MHKVFRIIFIFMIMSILTACHCTKKQTQKQPHGRKIAVPHKGEFFSLAYCINTTLKHRTDYELYTLNKRIKDEKVTAKTLGTLYDRGKYLNLFNTYGASRSIPTTIITTSLKKILNVLDFSIAYLNAYQEEDRNSLTVEQKKRIRQNLKLAVTEIYFQMALGQYAIKETKKIMSKHKELERLSVKLLKEKKITPLQFLDEKKRYIRIAKSLIRYHRNYKNVCRELRIMMGLVKNKKVDIKCLENSKSNLYLALLL